MSETESARWSRLTSSNGGKPIKELWPAFSDEARPASDGWRDTVCKAYAAPGRRYHTLEHVRQVLAWRPVVGVATVEKRTAFQWAAWFHDAVHEPDRADNEDRSAALLSSAAGALSIAPQIAATARRWILATKTHDPAVEDAGPLCDADLAILGAPPAVYDGYRKAIRFEYQSVPDAAYHVGRSRVLRAFLDRARIFRTPSMHDRFEKTAARNLSDELKNLG